MDRIYRSHCMQMRSFEQSGNRLLLICNGISHAGDKVVRYPMRTNIRPTEDTPGNEISLQTHAPISPIVVNLLIFE